jgi:hypothetical protein
MSLALTRHRENGNTKYLLKALLAACFDGQGCPSVHLFS